MQIGSVKRPILFYGFLFKIGRDSEILKTIHKKVKNSKKRVDKYFETRYI
jgi:hypothetical protein